MGAGTESSRTWATPGGDLSHVLNERHGVDIVRRSHGARCLRSSPLCPTVPGHRRVPARGLRWRRRRSAGAAFAAVAQIVVAAPETTLVVGHTAQVTATARDSAGIPVGDRRCLGQTDSGVAAFRDRHGDRGRCGTAAMMARPPGSPASSRLRSGPPVRRRYRAPRASNPSPRAWPSGLPDLSPATPAFVVERAGTLRIIRTAWSALRHSSSSPPGLGRPSRACSRSRSRRTTPPAAVLRVLHRSRGRSQIESFQVSSDPAVADPPPRPPAERKPAGAVS